ncbi:MAG: polyphosphate polymerase domain-containing protein [Oscillospiraceae bacterium]
MKNYKNSFCRKEIKYLVNKEQHDALVVALEPWMIPDVYGEYAISSLYFDTATLDSQRETGWGPVYKEKLRLRTYGTPKPEDASFLELKKKFLGITYKRRIALPYGEAMDYLLKGIPPTEQGQIFQEIDWFVQRENPQPMAVLCYNRSAFAGKEDPEFRMTFDRDIFWRSDCLDLSAGDFGERLLDRGDYLLEIKVDGSFPLWLSELLGELEIYPVSFSKYRTVSGNIMSGEVMRHAG